MIKWILRVNFFKKLKNNMRENIDLNSQIFICFINNFEY